MKTLTSFAALVALALPVSAFAQQSAAEEAMDAAAAAAEDAVADSETYLVEEGYEEYAEDPSQAVIWSYIEPNHVQIDYPPESFLAGEEGDVGFRVDVGADSKPIDCTVTTPSEFERLNAATCPFVLKRAEFRAGVDEYGQPVAGTVDETIYWKIRTPEFEAFSVRFAFTQTATGEQIDCELISFSGTAPKGMKPDDPCDGFSSSNGLHRDANGVPVSKRIEVMVEAKVSDLDGTGQDGE